MSLRDEPTKPIRIRRRQPNGVRTEENHRQLALLPTPAQRCSDDLEAISGQTLWMAVWLPHLALDVLAQTGFSRTEPLIVVEDGAHPRVHDGNRSARRAGVRPGMVLADALTILNSPAVFDYRPELMHSHLETLSTILLQFSDHVCPEPQQQRILLEIGRSLQLFQGLQALCRRVRETLQHLGYSPCISVAHAPAAARLLVGLRNSQCPIGHDAARRILSPLPLAALPLPAATTQALRDVGLSRIGDLLRFSRADLALRYGNTLPKLLDRLLGHAPETLPRFQPPEHPDFRLDFDQETTSSEALKFPLKRLLLQMEQTLYARHRTVQCLELQMMHSEGRTSMILERSQPGHRAEAWLELWNIRLSRQELPAPVRGIRLTATRLLSITENVPDLFGSSRDDAESNGFLARIRARLGDRAVLHFAPTLHPLPELAQIERPAEATGSEPVPMITPAQRAPGTALWIHPSQPCVRPVSPVWLGRLEGGWWLDGNDQRRDYARARDRQGRLRWVFQDLRNHHWHTQGFWG
jgi:protein ImuB